VHQLLDEVDDPLIPDDAADAEGHGERPPLLAVVAGGLPAPRPVLGLLVAAELREVVGNRAVVVVPVLPEDIVEAVALALLLVGDVVEDEREDGDAQDEPVQVAQVPGLTRRGSGRPS
jgi:hypothetical protein